MKKNANLNFFINDDDVLNMIRAINTLLMILTFVSVYSQEIKIPEILLNNDLQNPENKAMNLPADVDCSRRYRQFKYDETQATAIVRRNYDVLTYDLYMDWYNVLNSTDTMPKDRIYTGINKIKILIDSSNTTAIDFDAAKLQIDSVFVDNEKTIMSISKDSMNLNIILPQEYNLGDTLNVIIYYKYIGEKNNGFNLYPKGQFIELGPPPYLDSIFIEERSAYTFSEPENARYWMPCNDAPYDKALSKISVRVPKGYQVASNGKLLSVYNDNSSSTFSWREPAQITTYLMVATASKYKIFSDWYHKRNNPNDSIEIVYYVWEKDYKNTVDSAYNPDTTDAYKYNARHAFNNVVGMMEAFTEKWIEYPFVKYGMATVPDFGGGMEHQTMTTIDRNWIRDKSSGGGNAYGTWQRVIAHELAHMWLGDLITCATWKDIWINEGGATWGEAIYREKQWGSIEGYYSRMREARRDYLRNGFYNQSIYDTPKEFIFWIMTSLTYAKASWVYHMLRTMLGDDVFFPAFRNLLTKHANTSIETEDFKNSFKESVPNPPVPFDTYFDQWVYHAGHPIYELSTVSNNWGASGYDVTVNINQVQPESETIPGVFVAPLVLKFFGADTVAYDTVINDTRNQSFSFRLGFQIDSVIIDTNLVLCELSSSIVSVRENKETESIAQVFPNPVTRGQSARFNAGFTGMNNVSVDIYDNLGNKLQTVYEGYLDEGKYTFEFNTREFVPGAYMILCRTGDKCRTFRFTVL
ncbi:MAG: M1 family metallopeptidase [Ignavibacteriae bacterium]|nr:M1 family metallopeptidase [Ignavibacteriota bacterium]